MSTWILYYKPESLGAISTVKITLLLQIAMAQYPMKFDKFGIV